MRQASHDGNGNYCRADQRLLNPDIALFVQYSTNTIHIADLNNLYYVSMINYLGFLGFIFF